MVHFESNVVLVQWRADLGAVQLAWKGFAKGEEFKQGLNKGLELVKLKRAKKWLGDTSKMSAIPKEDQEWVNTQWFPALMATGLTSMAVILPASAIAKMSVSSIVSKFGGLEVQNFGTVSEGESWLKSKR